MVTNASAANNSITVYSSAKTKTDADGNRRECDLVFCTRHKGGCTSNRGEFINECYCCEPDPKKPCFRTRSMCNALCPFCDTT
jgi:hypothetical protein